MLKQKTATNWLISQFMLILSPVVVIMLFQIIAGFYHSILLDRIKNATLNSNHGLEAKLKYKEFINGVVDAVDTGQLSAASLRALEDSAGKIKLIVGTDHDADVKKVVQEMEAISSGLAKDRSTAALLAARQAINAVDKDIEAVNAKCEKGQSAMIAASIRFHRIQTTVVFIAIVLTFIFTFSIIRRFSQRLAFAVGTANRIAKGELSGQLEVKSENDIGQLLQSLQTMNNSLYEIVSSVKSTADDVAAASQQMNKGSEEMAKGLAQQVEKASAAATAATQMSQTVLDIAKNAANIASSATNTSNIAKEGGSIVNRSVEEVKAISASVKESAIKIASLGDRSKQIGEIISVISDIADQTNLLALNAAIEAARAGEQGRGFAVVADEVRKLAERTAKATSEIGGMIKAIQDEVSEAVAIMESGTKRVEEGVEFSVAAGNALGNIVQSVTELQTMVQQIAAATEEMSAVSDHINSDIDTISSISKQTSEHSVGTAHESSRLAGLATSLQRMVSHFKIT